VLLGLLLPDPCDPKCPHEFKEKAKKIFESMLVYPKNDVELQKALLKFIGDYADWNRSNDQVYVRIGRELVKAAHPEETPLVVDPFAGGGAIPLEALRIGCDAFASDLNPVACLILKVMLEDIPRHGSKLAEELRKVGAEIKVQAERELAEFYPSDSDGAHPIAYIWARTVRCEAPDCGAEIPLMRSFWLAKKPSKRSALRLVEVEKTVAKRDPMHCIWGETSKAMRFEISVPQGKNEVADATVSRAKATCPCCGRGLPPSRVRAQLAAMTGGADVQFDAKGNRIGGAMLLAVVRLKEGVIGRHYRLATKEDYAAVLEAQTRLKGIQAEWDRGGRKELCPVPNEPTPAGGGSGAGRAFSVQNYGMMTWADLFTARQKVGLTTLGAYISRSDDKLVRSLSALALSKLSEISCALSAWEPVAECPRHVFGRQALPMSWDFSEAVTTSDSSGSYLMSVENTAKSAESVGDVNNLTHPQILDACYSPLPDSAASVWFTDPPYYDAVPYADLSDFFFVWLKRTLPSHPLLRDPFDAKNLLTPKTQEAVQDETKMVNGRPKDRTFFEDTMAKAFAEGRRVLKDDGVGCVVFAHKTTEGWEALLSGMIGGGLLITGSWPIATEMGSRLRARDSAALATSVHLVCRPRSENAPVGEWAEVLRELPKRVGDWMERLHNEGVRGADMVFACIGPALEIYSRYSRVETAEGRAVELPEYLGKVWEVVGRKALENVLGTAEAVARNGAAGALEEDARLTALFLWTIQSTSTNGGEDTNDDDDSDIEEEDGAEKQKGGCSLVFDVARRFSQPLGIDLSKWEGRIIKTEKGVVHLLPVHERAKQLFGDEGAQTMADRIEDRQRGPVQMKLLPEEGVKPPEVKGRGRGRKAKSDVSDEALKTRHEATTLDKVHAAMLLQDSGRTNALRALIEAEQQRGPEFMRLANALSALYPPKSEEKRLLDAMILSAPR
jgi:adenine-specific DNA methylase